MGQWCEDLRGDGPLSDIVLVDEIGIQPLQAFQLTVFYRYQTLLQGCQFNIEVELRQIEVRGEHLTYPALVPLQGKRTRFVHPVNMVEVQNIGKLLFTGVSESYHFALFES